MAEAKAGAARDRQGYEQEGFAKLEAAEKEWTARLAQQEEAAIRSAKAAEAAMQSRHDTWEKVSLALSMA